jgi:hypothetical protein
MRYLGLSIISSAIAVTSLMRPSVAQEQLTGEVQAATPCQLYAQSEAPACPQVMIPIKSTLQAIPVGRPRNRRAILLKSDSDGHISALIHGGTYRIVLRRVETTAGRFNPRSLKITPNRVLASRSTSPTLFLISHRSRPTISVGISPSLTSD